MSGTLEALAAEAPGPDGHREIVRLTVNSVAAARGLPQPWSIRLPDDTAQRVTKLLTDLGDLSQWGAAELGALREQLLDNGDRSESGAWHTPPELAQSLTRAALSEITDLYQDDDPTDALSVSVLDPACGGGVFLLAAARRLASVYVGLMYGTRHPAPPCTCTSGGGRSGGPSRPV